MQHSPHKLITKFYSRVSMKQFIVIVFCICFSIYKGSSANFLHRTRREHHQQKDTLKLVHLIFRHGDRTPIDEYPKDPYNDLSYWPEGWGQLTKIGKNMHLNLGRFFRTRYDGFLSPSYLPSEVYVRSSDSDRTIMSALANLAGLFPPTELDQKSVWNPDIKWQPIPVHALPASVDNLIAFKKSCPRYKNLLNEFLSGPVMQEFDKEHLELYSYLSEHTGLNVTSYNPVSDMYDTLKIQKLYNLTLPAWTNSVFPDKMYPAALIWVQKFTYTEELERLRVGPFISQIIGTMDRSLGLKTNSTLPPEAKVYMYASHDDTVTSILKAFNVYEPHIPSYASTIFIELHKNPMGDERPYVKIFYRTDLKSNDADELEMKMCGNPCYLDKLKELFEVYIQYGQNWNELCEA